MSNFLATGSPLAGIIAASLEKDGTMQSVRTTLKAQVFKQLSQVSRGKENSSSLSNLNKFNQVKSDERCGRSLSLVYDLLNSMGLYQTASLLKTETGSPVEGSASRSALAMELGVSADSDELPLMFQVLDAVSNMGSTNGSPRKILAVETITESTSSKAQLASVSSPSLSPSEPKSASPPTQARRDTDFNRSSPRISDSRKSSPKSSPKSSFIAAPISPAKSVESAFNESMEESIDSIKSSPGMLPVKPAASLSPGMSTSMSPRMTFDSSKGDSISPAAKSISEALSPERKPLTPSSSPSKSPQTKVSSPKNALQGDTERDDQNAPGVNSGKDLYTNYQNVLDSEEFKSATASRRSGDSADQNVDSVKEQSPTLQTSVDTIFPTVESKEREIRSLSLNSDDDLYLEAVSRSLEEVPEEEDSPEESFATAGSYDDTETGDLIQDVERMPLSSHKGREDVNAAKVKKITVGESIIDREEMGNSSLGRANVTRLGGGGTSRLSRSNAGWNVVGSNSPVREDGHESFDLPAQSSPAEKSSSEPGSKRSTPRNKNISDGVELENLSDSFELEELGHSDGSNSPADVEGRKKTSNQEEDLQNLNRHPDSKKGWGNSPPPRLESQASSDRDFELDESFDSGDSFDDDDDEDSADFGVNRSPVSKENGGMFLSRTKSGTFQSLLPKQSSPSSSPSKPPLRDADELSNPDSEVKSLDEDIDDFENDFELQSPAKSSEHRPSTNSVSGFSRIEAKPEPEAVEEEEEDEYDDNFDDYEEENESPKAKQQNFNNNHNDDLIEDDLDDLSVGEEFDQSDEW